MNISKDFKGLDKFSLGYKLLHSYVNLYIRLFYRKFNVHGLDNLPKNKAYIIAPNHQAAIDPIVILKLLERPVFIARGDLFKKKFVAKLLIFFKIAPSFRIRDGKENLKYNEPIFKRIAEVLNNNVPLITFPEARHSDKHHILPLKKGITRMAFQAEMDLDFKLNLQIIPAGIYYSNNFNFQSDATIIFGKAISVHKYKDLFLENPNKANAQLRDEIAVGISNISIDIQDLENYDAYEIIRSVYRKKMLKSLKLENKSINNLRADKATIELLEQSKENKPTEVNSILKKGNEYHVKLKKHNFRDWLFEKEKFSAFSMFFQLLGFLVFSPVFLYGFLNNYLAIQPQKFLNKKIGIEFHSIIKLVMLIFVVPLIHLLQFALVSFFTEIWWVQWIYLASLVPSGLFAHYYYTFWIKFKAKNRFNALSRNKNKEFTKILNLRKEIISEISKL